MGIAHETANIYWTFDGVSGSISRYDFQRDHGPGYDDHSDGVILRYVPGEVDRIADVPSHLEFDRQTDHLYIADTGNARIAVLDTTQGNLSAYLPTAEAGTQHFLVSGVSLTTFADAQDGLERPSGIAFHGNRIYVTDNQTARITAFDRTTGARIDWLDTGYPTGTLMGITVDTRGRLYIVDALGDRVLRISAKP
jgi:DNA-binding beta-propeller fold protein YncE